MACEVECMSHRYHLERQSFRLQESACQLKMSDLLPQVKHRDLVEGCADIHSLATLAVVHVGPPVARPKTSLGPRANEEYDEIFTSASTSCLAWTRGAGEDILPSKWHLARRRGKRATAGDLDKLHMVGGSNRSEGADHSKHTQHGLMNHKRIVGSGSLGDEGSESEKS
ncbi:hypothetical protein OG21DRAFT_1089110 [Imleria badia]|nr:hypothetical protein OG21DRAFT_1089110 [Imleria badia]